MRTTYARLRTALRRLRAQRAFWVAAVAVGAVSVLYAQMFAASESLFRRWHYDYPWLPFLITPLVGIACLWITRRWFAGAEGGGIAQVMVELERRPGDGWAPLVSLRIAVGKVLMSCMAATAGFSIGREAPSVQIGAAIMGSVRDRLHGAGGIQERHLLVAGGAAGIAAAFNAPLAGVLFALEELNRGFEARTSALIITAIVLAGFVARGLGESSAYFGEVLVAGSQTTVVIMVLASAVLTGVAGGFFTRLILSCTVGFTPWLGRWRRDRPYALVAVCGLVIAVCGAITGGLIHGSGTEEILLVLQEEGELPWYYALLKAVATFASAVCGIPGGVFAPALAIGAGIGQDIALVMGEDVPQGVLVALCMCGFLAAVTQAPITAFIIVMEMVDGYAIVIGLMLVAVLASSLAGAISPPLFTAQAKDMLRRRRAASSESATSGSASSGPASSEPAGPSRP